jgi:CRISPR system Cascade subunit CasC
MTTFLQLHLLTAYPPANLNRDDSGAPKTAIFGGVQRLRISSQSLKRAWRTSDVFKSVLAGRIGERTQRIGEVVEKHLLDKGVDPDKARAAARKVADAFGAIKPEADKNPTFTEQLVFIAPEEREKALVLGEQLAQGKIDTIKVEDVLVRADSAADIAMFGRMLADDPGYNREAAVQVAHAITTHKVAVEDDYYVAVDDLKDPNSREDAGSSFIGVQEFAAGLFYIYICIDLDLLVSNLKGDKDLARDTVEALIRAAATVAPKGKQASFASRAYALFFLAEAGSAQPRSLAAAFLKPISDGANDLAVASVRALRSLKDRFAQGYGQEDMESVDMDLTGNEAEGSLDAIIEFSRSKVSSV